MGKDRAESKFFTVDPDVQIHYWDRGGGRRHRLYSRPHLFW